MNPHVQTVQNMYSRGGEGVLKAELRAAEVDPGFEICCDAIAVSKKVTLFFGPITLKRIEHGVRYMESMFFSFQSDRTKNTKVLVFLHLLIFCNTTVFGL